MKLLAPIILAALAAQSVAQAGGHDPDRFGRSHAAPAYAQRSRGHDAREDQLGAWRELGERRFEGDHWRHFEPRADGRREFYEPDRYYGYRPYRSIDPWYGDIVIRIGE
jgi:hypothetical protein